MAVLYKIILLNGITNKNKQFINQGSRNTNFLAKLGDKAKTGGENLDEKISKWSDAAKNAYKKAKEKAGDAWDKVKDVYGKAINAVETSINVTKEHITNMAEQFKIKSETLINSIATKMTTLIASNNKLGKQLVAWSVDPEKYKAQLAAFTSLTASMLQAINVQYDKEMIMDVYKAAFAKTEGE